MWNINAQIKLNQTTSKYEVIITLNGNIFKTIETVEGDPNFGINKEGMTSSDGNLVINPNNNTLGAITLNYRPDISAQYKDLKSQIFDFTYSINNDENKEDVKVNTFGFDEGKGTNATSVTTTPESVASNTTITGLDMTLKDVDYTDTYCGNQFDTDGDGYKDYKKDQNDLSPIDNCRTIFNPDRDDTDKDGIGNVCDNCEHPNPLQIDTDGDGKGDDVIVNGVLKECDNCKF